LYSFTPGSSAVVSSTLRQFWKVPFWVYYSRCEAHDLGAIHRHLRRDFLIEPRPQQRLAGDQEPEPRPLLSGQPCPLVPHDASILVHVDVFAEVEDAVGPLADGEEVTGHLDEVAALGFPLLHDARLDAGDGLRLAEDGDHQPRRAPLEHPLVARFEDEVRIAAG